MSAQDRVNQIRQQLHNNHFGVKILSEEEVDDETVEEINASTNQGPCVDCDATDRPMKAVRTENGNILVKFA